MITVSATGERAIKLGSFRAFQQYKIYCTSQNGGRVTKKDIKWKKRTRKGDFYSIFIPQLVIWGLVIMERVNNL